MAATLDSQWENAAHERLSAAGHRSGGAREAVVKLLARQSCCLSAQEISDRLRCSGGDAGIASIYRALDVLHELGLVQRVELGGQPARYEPVVPGGDHHHHAVCDSCGRVEPFEDPGIERSLERLAGQLRHSMSHHDLVIHGQCPRCTRT